MKKRNRANSSSLFLIELIFAIFLFAVASSVCVQLFVKAHVMSNYSEMLNVATNELSSAAELVCSADSMDDAAALLSEYYPDVNVDFSCEDNIMTAHMEYANDEGELIYELTVEHFIQGGLS